MKHTKVLSLVIFSSRKRLTENDRFKMHFSIWCYDDKLDAFCQFPFKMSTFSFFSSKYNLCEGIKYLPSF